MENAQAVSNAAAGTSLACAPSPTGAASRAVALQSGEMMLPRIAIILCMVAPSCAQSHQTATGTIIESGREFTISTAIRRQLPDLAYVAAVASTPNTQIVVYGTVKDRSGSADFMDDRPHIAFVRAGKVVQNIDVTRLAPAGPIAFRALAILPGSTPTAATAFSLGADGAASFFLFFGETHGEFRVKTTLQASQAQLRFGLKPGAPLEFWIADGEFYREPGKQCTHCLKFYRVKSLEWRGSHLQQVRSVRTKRGYQPDQFADHPFRLIADK